MLFSTVVAKLFETSCFWRYSASKFVKRDFFTFNLFFLQSHYNKMLQLPFLNASSLFHMFSPLGAISKFFKSVCQECAINLKISGPLFMPHDLLLFYSCKDKFHHQPRRRLIRNDKLEYNPNLCIPHHPVLNCHGMFFKYMFRHIQI